MTKQIRSLLTLAFAACLCSTLASAQRGPDVFFGVGTATDSATGPVDTFGDGVLYNAPKLAGSFGKVGGDFMLTKHFGIGAETDFRFGQSAYAGVQYYYLNNPGQLDGNQALQGNAPGTSSHRDRDLVQYHLGVTCFF